ncbi:MAG: IS110 family transposase [Ardenticatenia bacterium]|nr:IS110 family transposase [Ardenticatenia bacterium]
MLSTIEQLSSDIRAMDKQVKELIESTYPEAAHLQQVSGVGPITSLWYILTLEDPSRFAKSRVVGAYLGLCPGQRSSGEQRPQLGISKAGDETLRRYLVQAAHCVLGPLGPDSDLRRLAKGSVPVEEATARSGPWSRSLGSSLCCCTAYGSRVRPMSP